ncbi:MAG: DNA polymerase Y family protein [Phycisphaeraceae bacterium]
MLHQVMAAMCQLGLTARPSIAPNPGAAWAMARFGGSASSIVQEAELMEAIERLPVAALRIDAQAAEALADVNIERVGELLSLPRESLMERFGGELLRRLDQVLGRVPEAVEPLRPHEPVRVSRAFDGPVLKLEAVQQTVRGLIEALCDQLRGREAGVRRLVLHVERIDADDLAETLRLTRPSRDARHLWALLRPRVERLHLGHGIEGVTLHAAAMSRLPAEQLTAWHDGSGQRDPAALDAEAAELVDRLVEQLGDNAVTRMQPVATHVPERAFAHRPIRDAPSEAGDAPLLDADRPTWLLARPEPVEVVALSPDGPVASMQRGGAVHRIVASIGPERITPRWWLAPPGRSPAPRDYFIVQDHAGRWWWLYREAERGRWYLHGQWR